MPIVAIPTTYSGSEMTPVQGLTEGGVKRTRARPEAAAADRDLRPGADARAAARGLGHLGHERDRALRRGALRPGRQPDHLADGRGGHPGARREPAASWSRGPADLAARSQALYGAWLAGTALGAVGMALHHKLCHTLGGSFNLPHAETHTLILPQAAAYNRDAAPEAMARIARALGARAMRPAALFDLAEPARRRDAARGVRPRARPISSGRPTSRSRAPIRIPAPVTRDGVRALLQDAYEGRRPAD